MSKIIRICDILDQRYSKKQWARKKLILEELIHTILSQNTTAKNCNEAFARLRGRFSTWNDVRNARGKTSQKQ